MKRAQPRRFSFYAMLIAIALTGGFFSMGARAADGTPRGGRVGWARLVNESSTWSVHEGNDSSLAEFIRKETSLNIDPTTYPVQMNRVEDLCAYPLIFTNNLTNVKNPKYLANLREYLHRGGFIYIDRCVNLSYSLEQEMFYKRHLELFARLLPGCIVSELPDSHPINRSYFVLPGRNRPNTTYNHASIYGVFDGGRMVMLLSNANLQCGWPQSHDHGQTSMKMIANIYVYAMTRPDEPAATAATTATKTTRP